MYKLILLLAFSFQLVPGAKAQEHRCFTDERYRELLDKQPAVRVIRQQLEDFTRQFVADRQARSNSAQTTAAVPPYIIPVVFHIVHQYGPENISDAQVIDCVNQMNADFRKLNADTSQIITPFLGLAADCRIEFRLATKDPNGNCTNGIDRIYSNLTYLADDNAKLNPWPANRYLNIWSVYSLQNSGAAAYAYLPGSAPGGADGIISRYDYIGAIGTSASSHRHTISHEVGHHFNLYHVWGFNNSPGVACGDDLVQDTPETVGYTSCNLSGSICNPPVIENVQNFMEYSYCSCMFTIGQRDRMEATLNSGVAGRSNLWTANNLNQTGVAVWPPVAGCAPVADFYTNMKSVCEGKPIRFFDYSWKGRPTSWSWSFPGGFPATSTDSSPTVGYANPGIYDVSLTVSNAAGTDSITRSGFILVNSATGISTPASISYDLATDFPGTGGWVNNIEADNYTWRRVTGFGANGSTSCLKIDNYNNVPGYVDEYITVPFDITNLISPKLYFYVANAQNNAGSADVLHIFTSTNCGENWTPTPYRKSGATLSTVGVVNNNFTPNSAQQWRRDSINLNGLFPRSNVRIKFKNISDGGNNTYIDEVTVLGNTSAVDDVEDATGGFALFPNPAENSTNVQFNLSVSGRVQVTVLDISGRRVREILNGTLSPGRYDLPVSFDESGIYLMQVTVGDRRHVRRIVVTK